MCVLLINKTIGAPLSVKNDVLIIGAGPFGCMSALFLAENGLSVTLIDTHPQPLVSLQNSLHAIWPSLNDPPTRADAAHGHDVALYLQDFCSQGLDCLKQQEFAKNILLSAPSFRIGMKDFEIEELQKAKNLGFGLHTTKTEGIFKETHTASLFPNFLTLQERMQNVLQKNKVRYLQGQAHKLTETQSHCFVEFTHKNSNVCEEAEVVILANGLQIAHLIPKYAPILVPMSDCLYQYQAPLPTGFTLLPMAFRASNGHISVTLFAHNGTAHLNISGPRFLLPGAGAGVDLTHNPVEKKVFESIERFHKEQLFKIIAMQLGFKTAKELQEALPFKVTHKDILVDCYPCDELPLLGEFGTLGKVLGNTGWLATGFSAGVWAAKIVTDLLLKQKSEHLHPRLQPKRLFRRMQS